MNSAYYNMAKTERDYVTTIIADVIKRDDIVVFAYLYGSFITDDTFRDIDVFVYLRNCKDSFSCAVNIKENILEAVKKAGIHAFTVDDFDVRVINDSPYDFAIDLLRDGRLIVDNDPELRTDYIEHISDEYRVNCFVLDEAYGGGR